MEYTYSKTLIIAYLTFKSSIQSIAYFIWRQPCIWHPHLPLMDLWVDQCRLLSPVSLGSFMAAFQLPLPLRTLFSHQFGKQQWLEVEEILVRVVG